VDSLSNEITCHLCKNFIETGASFKQSILTSDEEDDSGQFEKTNSRRLDPQGVRSSAVLAVLPVLPVLA